MEEMNTASTGIILAICLAFLSSVAATSDTDFASLSRANGQFALEMYKALSTDPGNLVFSPFSVHVALSMLYHGAAGTTKSTLSSGLHLTDTSTSADTYHDLITKFNSVSDVSLLLANKVYVKKDLELKNQFETVVREKFLSEVELIDFTEGEQASRTMNNWVEGKTQHKIKDLFKASDFNDPILSVLINTIYFKGQWQHKLGSTSGETFYLDNGEQVSTTMLGINGFYKLGNNVVLNAKLLEVPFKNEKYSMAFLLPNDRNGLSQLESTLDLDKLRNAVSNTQENFIEIKIPKFKIEKTLDLKAVLEKVGLGELFDKAKCNLSEMIQTAQPLHIGKAIQKVVIDVNKEGVEAAATSYFPVVPMSMPVDNFIADHPFLFALLAKEGRTINILFVGRVTDPTK